MLEALHSWHCPQTPLTFEHVDVCLYSQNSRKGSGVQGQHELHSELKVYKTPPKKKKKKKKGAEIFKVLCPFQVETSIWHTSTSRSLQAHDV